MSADKIAKVVGLGHIAIFVKDLERSLDFYKKLGFAETQRFARNGGGGIAFMECGTCILEIINRPDITERPAGVVDHFCVEVTGIDELVADLKAQGVIKEEAKVGDLTMFGGVKNIFFEGPDGERVEFFDFLK